MAFNLKKYTIKDFYQGRPPPTRTLAIWITLAVLVIFSLLILAIVIFQSDTPPVDCSNDPARKAEECKTSLPSNEDIFSLERFVYKLNQRQQLLNTQLQRAPADGTAALEQHLRELMLKLSDPQTSYQHYLDSITERVERLDASASRPLAKARDALSDGNLLQAAQGFQQLLDNPRNPLPLLAESHYQLCRLAMDDYRYTDAFQRCQSASQLAPKNSLYLDWTGRAARQLGRLSHAKKLFESALAAARLNRSKEAQASPGLLLNLGEILESMGQLDQAIEYYEMALNHDIQQYGEQHHRVARDRSHLGSAWAKAGETEKAINYLEQALATDLEEYDEHHPFIAENRSQLGEIWYNRNSYNKALYYFEQSLNSTITTFGEEHPDVATFRHRLGSLWHSLGHYDEGINHLVKTLAHYRESYDADHPKIASLHHEIGNLWLTIGEYDKAVKYFKLALQSHQKIHGQHHRSIADGHKSLGLAWDAMGQYTEAVEHYTKAQQFYDQKYGKLDPDYQQLAGYLRIARGKLTNGAVSDASGDPLPGQL